MNGDRLTAARCDTEAGTACSVTSPQSPPLERSSPTGPRSLLPAGLSTQKGLPHDRTEENRVTLHSDSRGKRALVPWRRKRARQDSLRHTETAQTAPGRRPSPH